MANYATVADVESEFKNIPPFSTTTAVKASQVQSFLDQASAYIDSKVGMRYELPISASATGALAILKTICLYIVVERLKPLLKVDVAQGGASKGNQSSGGDNLRDQAEKMLKSILENETDLTIHGAVLRSSGDVPDGYGRRSGSTKRFTRDGDDW